MNPEAENCVPDTQETYDEGANDVSKKGFVSETQNTSLNESQDFCLVDSEADESVKVEDNNRRKSVEQQILNASQSMADDKIITKNDNEDGNIINEKVTENENKKIKETDENVSSNICDSEKKDELSDEDEIIQSTPPHTYSPSKKVVSNINVTNLKRRAGSFDEPPAKIIKTTSMEDATSAKKQFEEEESHQFCESDDSYQDLFKNMEKNVIIEETQDLTNQKFSQNFLKSTPEHSMDITGDDKTSTHHFEQTNQQDNKNFFSQKCYGIEKDENLNVSAKLTDISANNSIVANADSINESNSQMKDDLSIEMLKNIISTSINEKSETEILEETDKLEKLKDMDMMSVESDKTEITEKNDDSSQIKIPGENQSSNKEITKKSRSSVELIYDDAMKRINDDENKSKPEVMDIDVDVEKNALNSSTEVIYDRKKSKAKPEVIEIVNDSREKIVLDSFGEGLEVQTVISKSSFESKNCSDFSYKSMESMKETSLESKLTEKKMMNGSTESKESNTDSTMNVKSDTYSDCNMPAILARGEINIATYNLKKLSSEKGNSFAPKDLDNIELINISDNETSSNEEKDKSEVIHNCALAKTVQMEREIGMYVKLKCLLHMDENTKEFISKELTTVQCEPATTESSLMGRLKSEDSHSSLADISDNKDSSPGSVNSNPQLYPLNPSRLSIMSSISSSSSASSAASLAVKLALKSGTLFSMPVGPAKHAKKLAQDPGHVLLTMGDKQMTDEAYDRMTREWKNHRLLTSTILNCANAELSCGVASITTVTTIDSDANVSNERLDDHHHLQKNNIHSSTPEVTTANLKNELHATPKSTKKSKPAKRPRSKLTKPSIAQTNGENNKSSLNMNTSILNSPSEADVSTLSRKKTKIESTENKLLISDSDVLANSSPREMLVDCLIGKDVFAKWSDNNYYPGKVADQLKNKYKVNFYDGKSKILIPEFVILIPKTLREGLSVYATTNAHDYDSSGIIVDVQTLTNSDNVDNTYYTIETDEGERLRVQMQDISLSTDQAKVLKEEMDDDKISLPRTPKAFGQVSLDNMVDGKRRSKRIGTPIFSTPKSRINIRTSNSASKSEPSISGISAKLKENENFSSDSNVESIPMLDEYILRGVQKEIIGTPYEHIVKGPLNRIKSKPRSKKKADNEQTIATLGPIPPANSNIFKGLSFILTCASLESLDRYHDSKLQSASSMEEDVTESDIETENEEDWMERPFVRDRLQAQIIAGGGKFYEDFNQIPKDEYKNTKLITNVPNTTAKSILCLSVGISPCNHKWIIRCCSEGKILSAAENALPTGWSLQKRAYVEMFQASGNKPLSEIVVIIPNLEFDSQFATFWQQVCENAGAVVLIAENSDVMETMDFDSDVVALSNQRCPSWAVDKANQLQIPLLSTTWIIQCLIEGKFCPHDQHPRYKYNYIPN